MQGADVSTDSRTALTTQQPADYAVMRDTQHMSPCRHDCKTYSFYMKFHIFRRYHKIAEKRLRASSCLPVRMEQLLPLDGFS